MTTIDIDGIKRRAAVRAKGSEAMKFRKKPIVIDAIQYTGEIAPVREFMGDAFVEDERGFLKIVTLEGVMTVDAGCYIIRGVAGEYYPCQPNIFLATYEEEKP